MKRPLAYPSLRPLTFALAGCGLFACGDKGAPATPGVAPTSTAAASTTAGGPGSPSTPASPVTSGNPSPTPAVGSSAIMPAVGSTALPPAGTWSDGLTMGPNGPIPLIVVDQIGYRPADPKFAILRDPRMGYDQAVDYTPGANIALVDAATGATVKTAAAVAWKDGAVDAKSGDAAWTFDFSDVTTVGKYFVLDVETNHRSPEFEIRPDIYRQVLRHAMRTFFYQRAGFEKTVATAGADWADGASHLKPKQDTEARSWLSKDDAASAKDLRGGWFDAGDYNKYTSWHSRYIINLLRTFAFYPSGFGDDFGIAESSNGVPDLLDEVQFGLDWLKRMQNEDGSLLCVQGLGSASPPSSVTSPSYYGPASTSATLAGAAAFAYAARILGARPEPALTALASDLKARAVKAWQWAAANPSVTYYNNDDGKQPGSSGLAAGQQEMDNESRLALKIEAAAYLFQQTQEPAYRDFFDANYADVMPNYLSQWQVDRHEAALDYATQTGATPAIAAAIKKDFSGLFLGSGGLLNAATSLEDPYRASIDQYTWGSNQIKGAAGRLLLLDGEYKIDAASTAQAIGVAANYVHYIHGVNPLGLVYLTNMASAGAEHSAKTLYHSWFSYNNKRWSEVSATSPGPAPGFLVGGPNPSYDVDGCCTDGSECSGASDFSFCAMSFLPPKGQPHAKSYLQFNLGWPANSWAVTENSNGYQTQYIRMLAAFVE